MMIMSTSVTVEMILFMIMMKMIMINSIIAHMKQICSFMQKQVQKLGNHLSIFEII